MVMINNFDTVHSLIHNEELIDEENDMYNVGVICEQYLQRNLH